MTATKIPPSATPNRAASSTAMANTGAAIVHRGICGVGFIGLEYSRRYCRKIEMGSLENNEITTFVPAGFIRGVGRGRGLERERERGRSARRTRSIRGA